MSSAFDWAIVLDVGVGLGVLLIGIGILIVCSSLARVFRRLNSTLDEVDRQIATLSVPVVRTLGHVDGIADTADTTVARLGAAVGTLETVAEGVGRTAKLASDAMAPAVVNVGAALTGITAGLRRLVSGRSSGPSSSEDGVAREGVPHGG